MTAGADERVVEGELADPADVFYVEWAQETVKKNVQTLNDMLGRLVVLTTSLTGGGLALLDKALIDPTPKLAALSFFLIALLAAVGGLLPIRVSVDFFCADDVRRYKQATTDRKHRAMMASFVLMACGLAIAVVGAYAKSN